MTGKRDFDLDWIIKNIEEAIAWHRLSFWMVIETLRAGKPVVIDGVRYEGEEALREYFEGIYQCIREYKASPEEVEFAYKVFKEKFLKQIAPELVH